MYKLLAGRRCCARRESGRASRVAADLTAKERQKTESAFIAARLKHECRPCRPARCVLLQSRLLFPRIVHNYSGACSSERRFLEQVVFHLYSMQFNLERRNDFICAIKFISILAIRPDFARVKVNLQLFRWRSELNISNISCFSP